MSAESFFRRVPDTLFSPLCGPNRHIYARLILDLYPLFFDQLHADVFPSRDTVRAEIEELLARLALHWIDEGGETADEAGASEFLLALRAYHRLREAGWLEEEVDGYRLRVSVPPAVATLWSALVEVARPEQVFYGGMVLSIYNNVQRALEDPRAQALAFRQAVREAQRFRQHLNAMIYGLKGLLGTLSDLEDHRLVLGRFFDDFVERFLVADYKRLKTRNNPFRFRQQILQAVRELEFDVERRQALVDGYLEQAGLTDGEAAWQELNRDIQLLRGIFEQVDEHLLRIDRYRARVERRVADTVRYLDRSQPGMASRLAGLLRRSAHAVEHLPDENDGLALIPLADPLPLSAHGLRPPTAHRRPPDPRPLRSRAIDPDVLARQQALRAYMDRRRLDPARIRNYLETQFGDGDRIAAEDLPIETVEDFIAFTHLRHIPYLPGAASLRRRYRVERSDGWVENALLRCPRFVVHRIKDAQESSRAT